MHPGQTVIALDIIGMIVEKPAIHDKVPNFSIHLNDDYINIYEFGNGMLLWRGENDLLKTSYHPPIYINKPIIDEYKEAIKEDVPLFVKVKLKAFYQLIKIRSEPYYWFHSGIYQNEFGLKQNRLFVSIRSALIGSLNYVKNHSLLRFFSAVHLIWIIMTIFGIVYLSFSYYRVRENYFIFWILLLCIPLSYYASYLIATTAYDFRFMYPSTLTIQIITFSFLTGKISKYFRS
jgi:hypothetical protein